MKRILLSICLLFGILLPSTIAQSIERFEATVVETIETSEFIQVEFDAGERGMKLIEYIPEGVPSHLTFEEGREILLEEYDSGELVAIDMIRRTPMYILFFLFLGVVFFVAKAQGLRAFLGMLLSFALLFTILLPSILAGNNPLLMTILTSALIVPIIFYLSHGISTKTHTAALGTLSALLLTGVLALIFTEFAHLTGFASEEVTFLQAYFPGGIPAKGLLLSGIIISLLGILDDVTITQASVVHKLREANHKLSNVELFKKAMDVGRDHIASVVNTLVLVYVGASLPLMLLFMSDQVPLMEALNTEVVAEEIIRMLVGSIGLVAAVPLTTALAVVITDKFGISGTDHGHSGCADH